MILSVLAGEEVVVHPLPADGDWSKSTPRTAHIIAPLEPKQLDQRGAETAGWIAYLPAGDPICRGDRMGVQGQGFTVHGEPGRWAICTVVQLVAGARSATINLRRPDTSAWAAAAEATTVTPGAVYASAVPAGIQAQVNRSDADAETAEELVTRHPYIVTVDQDLAPLEGDEVRVTSCPEDLSLVDRTLRIDRVVRGTERFERQLLCTLIDLPKS